MNGAAEEPPRPPISVVPPPLPGRGRRPRQWLAALLLLGAYPVLLGLISHLGRQGSGEASPLLQTDVVGMMVSLVAELFIFGIIFLGAWFCARPTAHQLFFRRERPWRVVLFGFLFSVGLRIAVGLAVVAVVAVMAALQGSWPEDLSGLRAETETVVDFQALVEDPVYLLVNMTFVSFVVAGFREELWRAGMLAALMGLFPRLKQTVTGRILAVVGVGMVFGLGHLPQGMGGVLLTTLLGAGLGAVMVWRWSIWEAVLAHGFFNATTFAMLYVGMRYYPEMFQLG